MAVACRRNQHQLCQSVLSVRRITADILGLMRLSLWLGATMACVGYGSMAWRGVLMAWLQCNIIGVMA